MRLLFKFLYHYFFGVIFSLIVIISIILLDYLNNGYWLYPEINNLIKVVFWSSFGFALVHYSVVHINKIDKNKNN